MAPLQKHQTVAIKRMMQSADWDILENILAIYLSELATEPVSGSNSFEELRALHLKQGKIDGLKEFFDKLDRLNFE